MRFHDLLDFRTNIAKSDSNTGGLDTLLGSLFGCLEEFIEDRIECNGECAIDNVAIDLGSVIDFHNIVFAEVFIVSWVAGEMGGTVIDTATGGEGDTTL